MDKQARQARQEALDAVEAVLSRQRVSVWRVGDRLVVLDQGVRYTLEVTRLEVAGREDN